MYLPGRQSYRIQGHDYTRPEWYYITICTHNRECLFGKIVEGKSCLNEWGKIVQDEWIRTTVVRPEITMDECVVMPNHVHGVIAMDSMSPGGATRRVAPAVARGPIPGSLGAIIGQFKSIATKRINALRQTPGKPVWQRNYYERIVRDENSLRRIREYIRNNPAQWDLDADNPVMPV